MRGNNAHARKKYSLSVNGDGSWWVRRATYRCGGISHLRVNRHSSEHFAILGVRTGARRETGGPTAVLVETICGFSGDLVVQLAVIVTYQDILEWVI